MLVYLSGPISATAEYSMEANIAAARDVFLRLIRHGINPICPHLAAGFDAGIEYERWMRYDFALIDVCTHVLMLPRWQASPGAVREREYALLLGKPVLYDMRELYD